LTCRPNCVGLSLGVAIEEFVDGGLPRVMTGRSSFRYTRSVTLAIHG
jgi:hypothetical protein